MTRPSPADEPSEPKGGGAEEPAARHRYVEAHASASLPTELELSLIVPAYNESARLEAGMGRLWQAVEQGTVDLDRTEVLLIDDASGDDTARKAASLLAPAPHVRVLRLVEHAGKGACVRVGMAEARGAKAAFIDADMAITPDQLPRLLEALEQADVAIGARALEESSADVRDAVRSLGAAAFNRFVNLAVQVDLKDTQCGFKGFRTPVGRLLFHLSTIERFAFDVEVLSLARRLGLVIEEVPVRWLRVAGSSIRPLRDPLTMVADVLGSRRKDPPAVPALAVTGPVGVHLSEARRALDSSLGPRALLVAEAPEKAWVLLPMSGSDGVRQASKALAQVDQGQLRTHECLLGLSQLLGLAPLRSEPSPSEAAVPSDPAQDG